MGHPLCSRLDLDLDLCSANASISYILACLRKSFFEKSKLCFGEREKFLVPLWLHWTKSGLSPCPWPDVEVASSKGQIVTENLGLEGRVFQVDFFLPRAQVPQNLKIMAQKQK